MHKITKTLSKLNKLSLPVTILIASLILGAFYFASEANKQKSIERLQLIKIEQEEQQSNTATQERQSKDQLLMDCLKKAQNLYNDAWKASCWLQNLADAESGGKKINDDMSGIGEACLLDEGEINRLQKSLNHMTDECRKTFPPK